MVTDSSTIQSLAGTVSGGGTAAVGAALATNNLHSNLMAYVSGGSVISQSGVIQISAATTGTITTLSAGISGGGTASITGAISLNKFWRHFQQFLLGIVGIGDKASLEHI